MQIATILSPDHAAARAAATSKDQLLRDLSHQAGTAVHVPGDAIAREILKREALGSTGVGGGIAIPHARIAHLAKPFGLFARLNKALAFEAIDGKPVDLVFMLLLPSAPEREEGNRNALASVARRLRDPTITAAIRKARDEAAIYGALTGGDAP